MSVSRIQFTLVILFGVIISNVVPVFVYKSHGISLQFSLTKNVKDGMDDFCTAKNVGLQRVKDNLISVLTLC